MNKFILSLLFLFFIVPNHILTSNNHKLYAADTNAFVTDLDLALKLSKETNQELVIIFSASWCGYCKTLKNDLATIKHFDNKIICIIDIDSNKKIARQFKVKNLPTSVMLNPEGQEITRNVGYEKPSYEEWLKSKD